MYSPRGDHSKNLIVNSIEFNRTPIEWLVFDCRIQLNANRIQKKCKNLIAFDCIWLPSITFDYIQLYSIKFFYKYFLILAYNPWPWRCWSNLTSPIGYIRLNSIALINALAWLYLFYKHMRPCHSDKNTIETMFFSLEIEKFFTRKVLTIE